jgi:intron-binding protein aquarius
MALYPTEEMIWDENVVPSDYHSASGQVLALPKLNLQFLTLHDYLLRNFELFRLESTCKNLITSLRITDRHKSVYVQCLAFNSLDQIRQDIEDAVFRLKPWKAENGSTLFHGWARMAQPVTRFQVVQVAKPNLGENKPSRVRADVSINLNVKPMVKREWESLRRHDSCFLVTVKPPNTDRKFDNKNDFNGRGREYYSSLIVLQLPNMTFEVTSYLKLD